MVEKPLPYTLFTERLFLILAGGFLATNAITLALVRGFRIGDWISLGVWAAVSALGCVLMERYVPQRDPLFFPITMFLSGWGILIIERLSENYIYNFADRQTLWLAVSVAVMLVTVIRPEPLLWLREYRYTLLVLGLLLLLGTIILGSHPTGDPTAPQLWLGYGRVFFQPSELLKIILVSFLASYLAEQYPALRASGLEERDLFALSPRIIGPILLMWMLSILILVWQRDLGTATLFFIVFLILLYIASGNNLVLIGGGVLVILAGIAGYFLFGLVRLRVDIWLNPWPYAENNAYQIVQSLMAFAAGGLLGSGIGQGAPTYVPVVHSDFVFAALAEEWGLVGVVVVIACFSVLVVRGMRTAVLLQDRPFYVLLAVGFSSLLAVQTVMIAGGVLKFLPLTGVTLPFISYGGSSMLVSFIIVGLLLRLSSMRKVEV